MSTWPQDPEGDLAPMLEASIALLEAEKAVETMPTALLTAADRCDHCGAGAAYLVWKEAVGDLLFCVHHWRKHFPSMADQGWAVSGSNPDLLAAMGAESPE